MLQKARTTARGDRMGGGGDLGALKAPDVGDSWWLACDPFAESAAVTWEANNQTVREDLRDAAI
jgi:hypothetical protein